MRFAEFKKKQQGQPFPFLFQTANFIARWYKAVNSQNPDFLIGTPLYFRYH